MNIPPELVEALRKRDVKFLVKQLFPNVTAAQKVTPWQCYIIRIIAFSEKKRISISAYTRWGKTQTVAIAVALYILINENKRVNFIGPNTDLASLIREYMADLILDCEPLLAMADLESTGKQRLKKEATKNRLTFSNNCEYRVVTAHGKGFSAMGKGGDLNIMDEAALISRDSYAKITRMLGDDPENSILVELMNPWDRNTKAFDHSISPRFERIEIGYRIGIKEGRTTKTFIDEQREDVSPLEFTVLYESKFPDESEDSIHSLKKIEQAEKNRFYIDEDIEDLIKVIENPKKYKEIEVKNAKKELNRYKRIISCDPAEMGLDETVIKQGAAQDNRYFEVNEMYSEFKSDPMELVGKLMKRAREYIGFTIPGEIHIDRVGIGSGAFSRLKELKREYGMKNLTIVGCHNGERPLSTTKDASRKGRNKRKGEFSNKKIENNWRLRDLLFDNCISLYNISKHKDYMRLKTQMLSMKWKINSSELKEIIKPDDSPDFNDALVYMIWRSENKLTYAFI